MDSETRQLIAVIDRMLQIDWLDSTMFQALVSLRHRVIVFAGGFTVIAGMPCVVSLDDRRRRSERLTRAASRKQPAFRLATPGLDRRARLISELLVRDGHVVDSEGASASR